MPPPNASPSSSNPASSQADASPSASGSFRILILGGGEAGLTALEALSHTSLASHLALVEPSTYRYDQPAWMRVSTQGLPKEHTRSRDPLQVPEGVTWYQQQATRINPEARTVTLADGTKIGYDYLLVALGTETHWDRVRHLEDHLGQHGICSAYGYEQAERTWDMIQAFDGGRALFTAPSTPFKGGDAPLQILRRAEAAWRETGVRDRTDIYFTTAAHPDLAGDPYADLMKREAARDDLHVYTGYELVDVRPEQQEAVFSVTKGNAQSEAVLSYDLLHVVPPMRPPALLEDSGLAYRDGPLKGYMDIVDDTFRHRRFDRVFGIGDVIGVAGVKTGERARRQAQAVAKTLRRLAADE
jgi:sulfide:quinone oxidoreductase